MHQLSSEHIFPSALSANNDGVVAIGGFGFLASYASVYLINLVMPIRASDEEQSVGLDVSEIGVEAYPEFK